MVGADAECHEAQPIKIALITESSQITVTATTLKLSCLNLYIEFMTILYLEHLFSNQAIDLFSYKCKNPRTGPKIVEEGWAPGFAKVNISRLHWRVPE